MRVILVLLSVLVAGCAAKTAIPSTSYDQSQERKQLADIYEARRQNLEQRTNLAKARIEELSLVARKELLVLMACQDKYATGAALITPESPENIILAALSACAQFESPVRKTMTEIYAIGSNPTGSEAAMRDQREAHRERLTRLIIEARSRARQ